MCASVVSGSDAPPVLDPAEDVLDFVALTVEVLVVLVLDLAVFPWWDARGDAAFGQCGPKPVAIITFVGEQFLGAGKRGKQEKSAFVVAHLPFGQQHHDRPAQTVTDGMEF